MVNVGCRAPRLERQNMTRNITIRKAVNRYLNERKSDMADSTRYNHSSQLKQFIDWCEQDEDRPELVGNIDPWDISDFQLYRRDEDNISNMALYNQMSTFRKFIEWCESRDLLEGISESMMMPNREDQSSDEKLEADRGDELLENLETYNYASLKHVLFTLFWSTGMRVGAARSLDLDDYHSDEMYLEINHRPEQGTPLKNKSKSEREVNLHGWVCEIIEDYIEGHRHNVTDDHGREPLLTTRHGRPHRTTLRKHVTTMTRPCEFASECPYDRTINECDATDYTKAARCPGSVSPHPLRRSAITRFLNEGHSKELISDRMDVSVDVLDKHYDARTEGEKRELRRELFEMD